MCGSGHTESSRLSMVTFGGRLSDSTYSIPGLDREVEILIDRWGVPHIYAETTHDVYFTQGFNAARDRLWQLDFNRRRSLGLLAEAFGKRLVPWDRAARRFIFRGDMRAEWLAYANSAKSVTEAFTAGINAYIDLVEQGVVDMPLEFRTLQYSPAKWEAADVARMRAHGLYFNIRNEVARAYTLHNWGEEVEKLRKLMEPVHNVTIPEGLDLSLIVPEILAEYDLGTAPVQFSGDDFDRLGIERIYTSIDGSNSWVLSPKKTSTGRAIVANDPHRVTATLPSLRYIAHLSGPDFDVIGGGEPLLPGISIGHNGKIAFGLTIFAIDQEDVFVLTLEPGNPSRYLYKGDWVSFETVTETIPVRGGTTVEVELEYSRFGPVIWKDESKHVAASIGAAWLEPGAAPYLGSIEYMRAETIEEFVQAMNRWATPPENQIVADTEGNIAWKPGGIVPIRHNWDGTLPVLGDGTYEWDGFADADRLPIRVNPEQGWVATANQMLLDEDHDPNFHVAYDWYNQYRGSRIEEMIGSSDSFSVRDAFDMQTDDYSVVASEVISLVSTEALDATDLGRLFRDWDFRMTADSGAALGWEVWWWEHLAPALVRNRADEVGHGADAEKILGLILQKQDPMKDHLPLVTELSRLDRENREALDDLFVRTLESADAALKIDYGESSKWQWGSVHTAFAAHPLAPLLEQAGVESRLVRTPDLPKGGSSETVGLAAYGPDYRQLVGSTFRVAVDVGNWDASLALNSPGQSGDLEAEDSQSLFERWVDGEPFPLLYSREAVEGATVSRITLTPAHTKE